MQLAVTRLGGVSHRPTKPQSRILKKIDWAFSLQKKNMVYTHKTVFISFIFLELWCEVRKIIIGQHVFLNTYWKTINNRQFWIIHNSVNQACCLIGTIRDQYTPFSPLPIGFLLSSSSSFRKVSWIHRIKLIHYSLWEEAESAGCPAKDMLNYKPNTIDLWWSRFSRSQNLQFHQAAVGYMQSFILSTLTGWNWAKISSPPLVVRV